MRRRPITGLPLSVLLLAAGCAGDLDDAARRPIDAGATQPSASVPSASTSVTDHATGSQAAPASSASTAGMEVHAAGPAGQVTIVVGADDLRLGDIALADGWEQTDDTREERREVQVGFVGPEGGTVRFEAELEPDGTLDVDVDERRSSTDGTTTVDLPQESGSVTFTVAGGRITLDSIAAADGWDVREEERDGDSFEVDLVDAERQLKVEFSAEFDDGSLELDYETRSGPGYESGDDDVDEDDD